jgi:nitrate/nitrite transport system substrate-binding protein
MANLSRRRFVLGAGATVCATWLTHGCSTRSNLATNTPGITPAVNINAADVPETAAVRLGFISLTDCAPLVIAKVKGYFDKYGMTDVQLIKEPSWSGIRDSLELSGEGGGIDGAHILSPMPYLMSEGRITARKIPMYILARLNLNGQGISIANAYQELKVGIASTPFFPKVLAANKSGKPFRYAVTFPGGTHDLWMRYWLASGGIDPDRDAKALVIPPPQMVVNMRENSMDACCVGEPWNAKLIEEKLGYSVLTTGELWKNHPEKAFTMRADWVDANPKATKALLMAIQEAQIWCDKSQNKQEMAAIISGKEWVHTDLESILKRAKGDFDYGDGRVESGSPHIMKFWSENASYPYKSHDLWFITENMRWGYLSADIDAKKLVDAVNREDLWKEAAKAISQEAAIPKSTSRGVETFFDSFQFDPENPSVYLESLDIKFVGTRSLDETIGN